MNKIGNQEPPEFEAGQSKLWGLADICRGLVIISGISIGWSGNSKMSLYGKKQLTGQMKLKDPRAELLGYGVTAN